MGLNLKSSRHLYVGLLLWLQGLSKLIHNCHSSALANTPVLPFPCSNISPCPSLLPTPQHSHPCYTLSPLLQKFLSLTQSTLSYPVTWWGSHSIFLCFPINSSSFGPSTPLKKKLKDDYHLPLSHSLLRSHYSFGPALQELWAGTVLWSNNSTWSSIRCSHLGSLLLCVAPVPRTALSQLSSAADSHRVEGKCVMHMKHIPHHHTQHCVQLISTGTQRCSWWWHQLLTASGTGDVNAKFGSQGSGLGKSH